MKRRYPAQRNFFLFYSAPVFYIIHFDEQRQWQSRFFKRLSGQYKVPPPSVMDVLFPLHQNVRFQQISIQVCIVRIQFASFESRSRFHNCVSVIGIDHCSADAHVFFTKTQKCLCSEQYFRIERRIVVVQDKMRNLFVFGSFHHSIGETGAPSVIRRREFVRPVNFPQCRSVVGDVYLRETFHGFHFFLDIIVQFVCAYA